MAHSLMPKAISDFGLKDAVLSLVDNLQLSHDLKINAYLNIQNRFTPKIETNLFRIIQEALNNIIKHAKAKSIFIHLLDKDGNLSLTIEDDGIGFAQNTSSYKEGIGLKNIENRTYYLNGKCTIESKPGKGTLILIEIPV
jgi:signal transduction histidine kinase